MALVHALDPEAGRAGRAFVHSPLSVEALSSINTILVGKLQLPLGLLAADGATSPYLQCFCLMSEGTGAAMMKSRRNLPRAGQLASH